MQWLVLVACSVMMLYVAMQYKLAAATNNMLVVFAADEVHGEMDVLMVITEN